MDCKLPTKITKIPLCEKSFLCMLTISLVNYRQDYLLKGDLRGGVFSLRSVMC